jgi:hypothetical protein
VSVGELLLDALAAREDAALLEVLMLETMVQPLKCY